uniref:Protein tyrosine phosphatase n=1 Tax=Glyptapanteles flavicoxis TaxID=463051 RepID=B7S8E3_9HYME|nr:protein tyrosine phosphatase [Glyptapanteles flavicoxis]
MATNCISTYGAAEFLQRVTHPECIDIISHEYASVFSVPIIGTYENFKKPKNKNKNRFWNIPCWDDTRVILFETNDGADYINANYINGFDLKRKFIATEQPMVNTLNNFWTMLWQENSRIIVKLSGGEEESKLNCIPYFSSNQYNNIIGDFIVKQEKIRLEYYYTETVLSITHIRTGESKTVHHYNYWNWPEDKFPDRRELLEFLLVMNKKYQELFLEAVINNQLSPGPIVVHGNSGIMRTPTFCAIDTCLYQLVCTATISVTSVVFQIRQQRNCSFPILSQYIFIYDVLLYFLVNLRSNYGAFMELRSHCTSKDKYLLYHPTKKLVHA